MLKSLILLALVTYNLQIDHCLVEEKVCETCKTGYNFYEDQTYISYFQSHKYCKENTPIAFCSQMGNVAYVK